MIDGLERDGIYVLDDIVHLIECTIDRKKEKAEKDGGKLAALIPTMQKRYPDKAVKAWFITKDEPTPDQRTTIIQKGRNLINAMSFEKFQSRMVDVALYRNCRLNYPFGSVRDPNTGDSKYFGEFIDVELSDVRVNNNNYDVQRITDDLISGKKIVIQGHYGVGKSMTLKEIYKKLSEKYIAKEIVKFPIYINLRDHQGQTDPVEVLERHARNIGFKHPDHLVRAWRAGYAFLVIDGYDEVAAFGWAGKGITLKEIRKKSMELLRAFVRQNPMQLGLLISGRINYFDSIKECEDALGVNSNTLILKLGDFTPEQTEKYLQKRGVRTKLPDWIPTRPLLLSYLVARNILIDVMAHSGADSPAEGWDYLLDEVCKRESAIEAGLSAGTVREIIEGLACFARQFQNGLGPIYKTDLERVFAEKCGYPPDDRALILLQRLPGLAPQDQQDGARYFIDQLFASAAKVGEIVNYVNNPYDTRLSIDPRKFQDTVDELAIELCALKLAKVDSGLIQDSIIRAKRNEAEVLAADILLIYNFMEKPWTREQIKFSVGIISNFEIKKDLDWSRVLFQEVIFKELCIYEMPDPAKSPIFENCIIGKLVGCSSSEMLHPEIFINPTVDSYDNHEITTKGLMEFEELPIQVRVGFTILNKLYLQSGSGRQENAFFRGLSTNEQSYVIPLLELFKHEEVALSPKAGKNKVWQPVKSQAKRIRNILINKIYRDNLVENMKFIAA